MGFEAEVVGASWLGATGASAFLGDCGADDFLGMAAKSPVKGVELDTGAVAAAMLLQPVHPGSVRRHWE